MEITIDQRIYDFLKEHLSVKRYQHTLRVMEAGISLAKIHKVNVKKVAYACLLHDSAKGNEEYFLKKYVSQTGWLFSSLDSDMSQKKIIHGPLAALIAMNEFFVVDQEVLEGMIYHTTGRSDMSTLEKIVFLADKIEAQRKYKGVVKLRNLAKRDLDEGVFYSMENTLRYLLDKRESIALSTIKTRNEILKRR